jgi:hypothetical protein
VRAFTGGGNCGLRCSGDWQCAGSIEVRLISADAPVGIIVAHWDAMGEPNNVVADWHCCCE